MKKSQAKTAQITMLGYSAAMAIVGGAISVDAVAASSCTDGSANGPVHCEFTTGTAPWSEAWSFTGSTNVRIAIEESANAFAACSYHGDGNKSFGLTLEGGSMYIRDVTGKAVNTASGCAN